MNEFCSKNSSLAHENEILYSEDLFETHRGAFSPNSVHHYAGTNVAPAKTRLIIFLIRPPPLN